MKLRSVLFIVISLLFSTVIGFSAPNYSIAAGTIFYIHAEDLDGVAEFREKPKILCISRIINAKF